MSTGRRISEAFIQPYQQLADEIELTGLTKLVAEGFETGLLFVDPDPITEEEWESELHIWNETKIGPYPVDKRMSTLWMPKNLVTKDKMPFCIIHAYTPVQLLLPEGHETYAQLKSRIESESMRVVEYVREELEGIVNAFYIGNLTPGYAVADGIREVMPLTGNRFLQKAARDVLVPRISYDLSLYHIDKE